MKIFFDRCLPQERFDAAGLACRYNRVFIGYSPYKTDNDEDWREIGCKQMFHDISDPDWHKSDFCYPSYFPEAGEKNFRRQVSKNKNMAKELGAGDLVLVPRRQDGYCLAGKLSGSFELVDQPEWAEEYLYLREKQELTVEPQKYYIGDIAQTWPIEDWISFPFTHIYKKIQQGPLSQPPTIGWVYGPNKTKEGSIEEWSKRLSLHRSVQERIQALLIN